MTGDASDSREPPALREVGEKDFAEEVLAAQTPVLVLFWTTWSPLDRQMRLVVRQLAETRDCARFVAVNVDDNSGLAAAYHLESVPTLLFFVNGREAVRLAEVRTEAELREVLDRLTGG